MQEQISEASIYAQDKTEQEEVQAEDPKAQALDNLNRELLAEKLSAQFGLQNVVVNFTSIEELDDSELKREFLETVESDTLIRSVKKLKNSGFAAPGIYAIASFIVAIFFLGAILKIGF